MHIVAVLRDARRLLICAADNRIGSLEPGKLADLVILSDAPMEVPVDALKDIEVETTVVGGQLVHSR